MSAKNTFNPIQFQLGLEFGFMGLDFTGIAEEIDNTYKLVAFTSNVDLRSILKKYGVVLPKELDGLDLTVKMLYFSMDSGGVVSFSGTVEFKNEKLGGDLGELGKTDLLTLNFGFVIAGGKLSSLYIELHGETGKTLLPEIQCKRFDLLFRLKNDGSWILAGSIRGKLFDLPELELFASYAKKGEEQVFQLLVAKLQTSTPLIKIPDVASIDLKALRLTLQKDSTNGIKWGFSAVGDFKIYDLLNPKTTLLNIENGKLSFSGDTSQGNVKLDFEAEEARIKSPRIKYIQVLEGKAVTKNLGFDINFGRISLEKITHEWSFYSSVDFYFFDIPSPLDNLFVKDKITGEFSIKKTNSGWEVYAGLKGTIAELEIPDISQLIKEQNHSDTEIKLPEIGKGVIGLYGIGINIAGALSLDLEIGLGLPSKLNELIGLKPHQIIRTYDTTSDKTRKDSVITTKLSIGTEISGVVKGSLFQDIKGITNITCKEKEWIELDLDLIFGGNNELGLFRIQKPELTLDIDSGSFKASGGYEIDKERKLKIPLFPIRKALELLSLDDIAKSIPTGIPVKSIKFFDENEVLKVGELKNAVEWMGIKLPQAIWDVIDEIAKVANHLPERFKDYLGINIPDGLEFAIEITCDGSVSFDLKVAETGDPLQLLIPMLPTSQFLGVRLRRLSFGSAFANALLKLEVDGEFDCFDLPTLAASAASVLLDVVPGSNIKNDIKNILPEFPKLQQTFIARDLVVLIIYETQIPIPIPLFYKKLELSYFGIEGIESKNVISFPKPSFNASELLNHINDLKNFFTVPYRKGVFDEKGTEKGLLPIEHYGEHLAKSETLEEDLSKMDIVFSAGPLYIRLPKYLGAQDTVFYEITNEKYDLLKDRISKENLERLSSLRHKRFLTADGFKWEVSKVISKDKKDEQVIIVGECMQTKPMGQLIGTVKNYRLFSLWDLIYLILNSAKKGSINYPIQYFHIDDRVGNLNLSLFNIFDIYVNWAITTPYEFVSKRIVRNDQFIALDKGTSLIWEDLSDKGYIDKGGGIKPEFYDLQNASEMHLDEKVAADCPEIYQILKNADTVYDIFINQYKGADVPHSPANELLELLADNDTGLEITEEDEGIAIFLRGGLDIGQGAVTLESAFGLMAGGVSGFRTGVSFNGYIVDIIDLKLLGFIKISPKSKTEPFKLLGKSSLKVFNREIVAGFFELTNKNLEIRGMLDLFPKELPIVLKGHIIAYLSKYEFLLDTGANFEIGILRALAQIYIHADKNESVLRVNLVFINSSLTLNISGKTDFATQASLDADLYLTALQLIEFKGSLKININGRGFNMVGRTTLLVGIPSSPLIKGETFLTANLDPAKGYLGIQSSLSLYFCFLSSQIRLSGGFAFFTWFSGEHAGDFLLSTGGYHPLFRRPAHYPVVQRIGLNWKVDRYLNFKGSAYFALTASCIMAGGRLEATWQSGGTKACFIADANFLMAWKPFQYYVTLSVSMRLSYTFIFFGTRTLSCELGASLTLWGPELSGKAVVYIWRISFPISFGKCGYKEPVPLEWRGFREDFLPKGKDDDLCSIAAVDGVLNDLSKQDDHDIDWVINPGRLKLSTLSAIPVKQVILGKEKSIPYKAKIGIAPMDLKDKDFQSIQRIAIKRNGENAETDFDFAPIHQNSPRALWGEQIKPNLNDSPLVQNTVTGFDIMPKEKPDPAATTILPISQLMCKGEDVKNAFGLEKTVSQKQLIIDDQDRSEKIISTLNSTDEIRLNIIRSFGFRDDDINIENLLLSPDSAFLNAPQIWEKG